MHNQLGGVCLSNVYTNIPWDSIHKFSSLVRYYPLRPAVTTKEREQDICHTHCSFIRQWSSFRPLGEVVSGRDDVLVSPRCLSQWTYSMHHENLQYASWKTCMLLHNHPYHLEHTNQVHSNLFPDISDRDRMQFFSLKTVINPLTCVTWFATLWYIICHSFPPVCWKLQKNCYHEKLPAYITV